MEIWRRHTDVKYNRGKPVSTPLLSPSPIAAISSQYEEAPSVLGEPDIEYLTKPTYGHFRGKYVPHAFISTPAFTLSQTLAFQYPVVAFVTRKRPYTIHVYDIEMGIRIRSINTEHVLESHVQSTAAMEVFFAHAPTSLCLSKTYVAVSFKAVTAIIPIRKTDEENFHPVIIYETQNPSLVKKGAFTIKKTVSPLIYKARGKAFDIKEGVQYWNTTHRALSEPLTRSNSDYVKTRSALALERFEISMPTEDGSSGALVLRSSLRQASAKFASRKSFFSLDECTLFI